MQRKKKYLISAGFPAFKVLFGSALVLLFSGHPVFSQDDNITETSRTNMRRNYFYIEFMGNGAVYSLNYDRIFPITGKLSLFGRVGGNEYHPIESTALSFNFILQAGALIGSNKSFFETGIGYTHFTGSPDRLGILTAGYRYQAPKGFLLRITPMYVYNTLKGDTFGNCPWFGFSVGYGF